MIVLLTLLTKPALAQAPADAPAAAERVDRLTEALGLTPEVAGDVEALVESHRTKLAAHRQSVKTAAQGLEQARKVADEKAMKRGLDDLRQLRDDGRKLADRHQAQLMDLLTLDQQVQWTLFQLRRRTDRGRGGLPRRPQ